MIQYTIEAYMEAGICQLCVIVSPAKHLIRDFLCDSRLPAGLPFGEDREFRKRLRSCDITILVQQQALGVADAVSLARDFVGSHPFACIMPDCLLFAGRPYPQQLAQAYQRYGTHVIGTILVPAKDIERFGNVALLRSRPLDAHTIRITSLSSKRPEPLQAPNSGAYRKGFGGGVYHPEYFELADAVTRNASGEFDDVPIHQAMIRKQRLLGVLLEGEPFDAGHPLGLRAAAHFQGRDPYHAGRPC